jgi:hypothetical protein
VDRTNSQPKSSPASVGSDQPIEVPDPQVSSLPLETPQPPNEPARPAQQPSASGRRDAQASDDESGPRHRRYYDDSDDMIERVRRARAAFEKKTRAFQGPDWPHYEKRVIVGTKKKEPATGSEDSGDSGASQTSQSQNAAATLPAALDKAKE